MKIVGFAAENMASSHLRVRQWIDALRERGHDAAFHADGLDELPKFDERVSGADVVIYGHTHDLRKVATIHGGKKVHRYRVVCDTDDLITDIPDYNFATRAYNPATGIQRIAVKQYELADAVTCSTRYLCEATKRHNPRSYLVPNVIDMRLWEQVRRRQKEARHAGDIRIYWGGGGGHWNDVLRLREPLLQLVQERPQVKLVFSNFVPDWAARLPPQRVYFLPLAEYRGMWQRLLTWLCIDIGLAPLVHNEFNRAKSHVKWLDYAMAGIAGVYEDIEAYETVAHGATGLKAVTPADWYDRINALIEHPELHAQIVKRARREVLANWTVDQHVASYERLLQRIVYGELEVRAAQPLEEGVACQTM